MLLPSNREATVLAKLKANARERDAKTATAALFDLAKQATASNKHANAAIHYAALAQFSPQNQHLPMRAARSYHKAEQFHDAARWYLEAAERYALMHQTTQAIATLRLYHEVAPGEYEGPKRVFNICHDQGSSVSGLYEFLSLKDRAKHALRAENIFAVFDDKIFDAALDVMTGHRLKKGDVLTRAGDKAESIYVVVQGRLDGSLTIADKSMHFNRFIQGDICCLIPYFKTGRQIMDLVAEESTDLLELPFSMLDMLCKKSPVFAAQMESLYRTHLLIAQLAVAPVFCKLDAMIRNEVVSLMSMQNYKAGEMVFHEGDASSDVYLLCSGAIAINLNINQQQEQLFSVVKPGALIGEISVTINGRRSSTARAISDCQMARLDGKVYQRLFDAHEVLRLDLEQRKKAQLENMHAYMRRLKSVDAGENVGDLLLKGLWGQ